MLKIIFAWAALLGWQLVIAQQSFNAQSGVHGVLRTTEASYEGRLDVNLEMDQILWANGSEIRVFGAARVQEAIVQLADGQTVRYIGGQYGDAFYLFEVLSSGRVSLYYREGIPAGVYAAGYCSPIFVSNKNGRLQPLEKKKDVLDLFGSDEKWMAVYIKNHALDLDKKADVMQAVRYYNEQSALLATGH